ncbi:MAG: polysaccharide deacetylase family protein [Deltaproteobacteria bacterium]|nr:polysaccharide deacetylase family protein [Deltaproteobacteria bacterium]
MSCYYDIHGIDGFRDEKPDVIYTKALSRILDFFSETDIKPTLFVVGRELNNDEVTAGLKSASGLGYEIANHTYSHLYNFMKLDTSKVEDEILGCEKIISDKLNVKAAGFRAPGYNINRGVVSRLIGLGYKYDSSLLPSPFYYFAKCGIIFFYKLTGRKTKSICGSVRMPFASRRPYRTDEEHIYCKGKDGKIAEIPVSVAGVFGIPYVGTFIMGYRESFFRYLLKKSADLSFLHIELHGIDFLDRNDISDERLCKAQFDVNIPLGKKLDRLKILIDTYNPERSLRLSDIGIPVNNL